MRGATVGGEGRAGGWTFSMAGVGTLPVIPEGVRLLGRAVPRAEAWRPERRRVLGCQSRGGGGRRKAVSGRPEEGPHPYLVLPKPSRNGHLLNEASECPS